MNNCNSVLPELRPLDGQLRIISAADLRDLIPLWMDALIEDGIMERTRRNYARDVGYYLDWLAANGRTGIYRTDVKAYRASLQDARTPEGRPLYRDGTIDTYLASVRAFYYWASCEGYVSNVSAGVHNLSHSRDHARDELSVEQLAAVLKALKDAGDLRGYAMILLMGTTGLRTIEVSRAQIGDIRTKSGRTLLYIQGKGRTEKDRFVVLSAEIMQAIYAYLATRPDTSKDCPLFASNDHRASGSALTTRSISRICKNAFAAVGIVSEYITAHSLRHTAITLALLAGASIQDAQAMAGHASQATTEIYNHSLQRMQDPAELRVAAYISSLV